MIAIVGLAIRIALEITLGCHCDRWATTPHGARCIEPRDHPRCELVEGVHPIAFGVLTCSKGNCE